ncbi:MAG: NUDIX hydrolase [Candidatus Micrarchaeota archaeon]
MESEKDSKNSVTDLKNVARRNSGGAEGPNTQTQGNNAQKQILYKDNTMTIVREKAKINGSDFEFLKIEENDAVVVLAVVDDHIILEKQYRPAIGKYIYELPAGHIEIEENESPINAAIREMQEETGYTPKKVSFLFKGYPMPGTNTAMVYFYLAEDLSEGEANPEADEDISVVKVSLEDAMKMIRSGEIIDLKTITGILYYYYIFKNANRRQAKEVI